METNNTGWICPRCDKVHARYMVICDCDTQELEEIEIQLPTTETITGPNTDDLRSALIAQLAVPSTYFYAVQTSSRRASEELRRITYKF